MITEEEFKDLTLALEGVGHYDPSVADMLNHIKASPVKWVGFTIEYTNQTHLTSDPDDRKIFTVKTGNFSEAGRFEKAIIEFAADPDKFSSLAEEMGMRIDNNKTSYTYEIIIVKLVFL
jgi:hypothetical protein